jgi:multidrug resistance efflux pump
MLVLGSVVTLTASGTGAWWGLRAFGGGEETAPVTEPETILCSGHVDVEPGVAQLAPTASGKVVEVLVKENQVVEAGTVLLRLDDRLARLKVQEARADLTEARKRAEQARNLPQHHQAQRKQLQAALEVAQGHLDAARQQHNKLVRLQNGNLTSSEEVQASVEQTRALEAAVRGAQEKLNEVDLVDPSLEMGRAKALVDAKQAQLEQAQTVLQQHVLAAPEKGTVLRILAVPGEVLAGMPAKPVLYFCPARPRIVRAEVSQEWANRVAAGQAAQLQDDGDPMLTWRGKVVRVSDWYTRRRAILQDPLEVQDVRTVECIIQPEKGPVLRIGQKLRVTITPGG